MRAGAQIGRNVMIGRFASIDEDVVIGDGSRVQEGARLFCGCQVGKGVFIGPEAVICNHRHPCVRQPGEVFEPQSVVIEDGANIGANATLVPPIVVGAGATVGAGSVVVRDVPAGVTVVGNPAVILKG